jgi:hypothetical protein
MSAWRILLQALADAGGGPIAAAKLREPSLLGRQSALRDASAIKAIRRIGNKNNARWELTDLGRGYLAGDLVAVYGKGKKLALVPFVPCVTDDIIEALMLESGHIPGDSVTPAVLRRYSVGLWSLAKNSVTERKK